MSVKVDYDNDLINDDQINELGRLVEHQVSVAVAGSGDYALAAAGTADLADAEYNASLIVLTGLLTGARNVIAPTLAGWRTLVYNGTTGAYALVVKTAAGTGVTIPQGSAALVACDGTNILGSLVTPISLTTGVTGILPLANGGTNAANAADARTSLGLGTLAVLNAASLAAALVPDGNGTRDLGASGTRWKDVFLSGNLSDGTNATTPAAVVTHLGGTAKAQHSGGVGDHTHASSGAEGGTIAAAIRAAVSATAPLSYDSGTGVFSLTQSGITHSSIGGITTGDAGHTQFGMLAGRAGGQTLNGGTDASETLTLDSTAHGTKGQVLIPNSKLGIGGAATARLTLTETFSDAAGVAQNAAALTATTAGSQAFAQRGILITMAAGYTGSGAYTAGVVCANSAAGTQTAWANGLYNTGGLFSASATTTGYNVGASGVAGGGDVSIGLLGRAQTTKASVPNVGVVGAAVNAGAGGIQTGGAFGLWATAATPTFESAGLLADNGAASSPIFLARDNGTVVFNIADGGSVCIGTTAPALSDGVGLDVNGKLLRLRTAKTPANAGDTGSVGEICWDASYFYVCTAANTWRRVAHATW